MLACTAKNSWLGRNCYSRNSTPISSTTVTWEGSLLQVSYWTKGKARILGPKG